MIGGHGIGRWMDGGGTYLFWCGGEVGLGTWILFPLCVSIVPMSENWEVANKLLTSC
jgi:hypothetical protein